MDNTGPLVELLNYHLPPLGSGSGFEGISFSLSRGEICAIEADNPDDAHQFMRALALLARPLSGVYTFKGTPIDPGNLRDSLGCKRKIGYIAPDAALLSNLNVRQNLLLNRFYFENDLNLHLDERTRLLCREFGIDNQLDKRPSALNFMEIQAAIIIRELCKKPDMLLLNRPEDYLGHNKFDLLVRTFTEWIDQQLPVVFLSFDRRLVRRFANRKVLIVDGNLNTLPIRTPGIAEKDASPS